MPEVELGKDPWLAHRGFFPSLVKKYLKRPLKVAEKQWSEYRQKINIPPYKPTNPDWNIAFRALGLDYITIKKFWLVFCRANKSRDGQICMDEFLEYFRLERTGYVEKAFRYFDTTGGGEIDFLEFVVSVWNVCSLNPQTLTNFTFDMYDVDSDGLLSCPEVEAMVEELFGQDGAQTNSLGLECMEDLMKLAEENGAITLDLFTVFTVRHSVLLFPIYQIQRQFQKKVLGLLFWRHLHKRIETLSMKTKDRSKSWIKKKVSVYDRNIIIYQPRHILVLLRSYKRERGGLDMDEEDMLQCKNLKEWVAKNDQFWHDDGWDHELPNRIEVLASKVSTVVIKPVIRTTRKTLKKWSRKVADTPEEKRPKAELCVDQLNFDSAAQKNIASSPSSFNVDKTPQNCESQQSIPHPYSTPLPSKQLKSQLLPTKGNKNYGSRLSRAYINGSPVSIMKGPPLAIKSNNSRGLKLGGPRPYSSSKFNKRADVSFARKLINKGKINAIYSPVTLAKIIDNAHDGAKISTQI